MLCVMCALLAGRQVQTERQLAELLSTAGEPSALTVEVAHLRGRVDEIDDTIDSLRPRAQKRRRRRRAQSASSTCDAQAFECDPEESLGYGWRALVYFLVLIIFGAFVMPTVLVGVISMSFEQSTMQVCR